ncbi:molybdenum ABC transporter ATP-binding protein [Sphingomonas montanisoli]|nr:molybdenum ABC transporter ATP-binding protein [Sphingomonas montanisoli]
MSFDVAIGRVLGGMRFAFDFRAGAGLTAVLGPSGAGKTTLMDMIAGIGQPDSGRIAVGGRTLYDRAGGIAVPIEERRCGYIFQDGRLFPHLNVRDNLDYGARLAGGRIPPIGFDALVDLLGLRALLDRKPRTLSGGEARRVAIGRALLGCPAFLLMDEPLTGLDGEMKLDVIAMIAELRDRLPLPILLVSHDRDEVERLADNIVLVDEGAVIAAGEANAILSDLSLPLARAGDALVILKAAPVGYDADYDITTCRIGETFLQVPGRWDADPLVRLRIRAADVTLSKTETVDSALNHISARIVAAEHTRTAQMRVVLSLGDGEDGPRLLSSITRKSWDRLELAVGDGVEAAIKAAALAERRRG